MKKLILVILVIVSCSEMEQPIYSIEGIYEETIFDWEEFDRHPVFLKITADSIFRGTYSDSIFKRSGESEYEIDYNDSIFISLVPAKRFSDRIVVRCPLNNINITYAFINLRFIQEMKWDKYKGQLQGLTFYQADPTSVECDVQFISKEWYSVFKKIEQ